MCNNYCKIGVDLGRWHEGLRISKRQRNGINICKKFLGMHQLWPSVFAKDVSSNIFFCLIHVFSSIRQKIYIYIDYIYIYIFREVNHLLILIGFHDWTKHFPHPKLSRLTGRMGVSQRPNYWTPTDLPTLNIMNFDVSLHTDFAKHVTCISQFHLS